MKRIRIAHDLKDDLTAVPILLFRNHGRRLAIVRPNGTWGGYTCTDVRTGLGINKGIHAATPRECLRRVTRFLNTPKMPGGPRRGTRFKAMEARLK